MKLRELAVALVEHISGAPAEQPDTGTPITPDERTREAARLMWARAVGSTASAVVQHPGLPGCG